MSKNVFGRETACSRTITMVVQICEVHERSTNASYNVSLVAVYHSFPPQRFILRDLPERVRLTFLQPFFLFFDFFLLCD